MTVYDLTRNQRVTKYLDRFVFLLGIASFAAFIVLFGFPMQPEFQYLLHLAIYGIGIFFIGQEVFRLFMAHQLMSHMKLRWVELVFVGLMLVSLLAYRIMAVTLPFEQDFLLNAAVGYLAVTQLFIFMTQGIRFLREIEIFSRFELAPSTLMVISFLIPIFGGTLLLKLPNATVSGISWIDALFTATSAVCVTGLVVVDTATAFTPLGQTIIFSLFQIGGLGIMTISMSFGFLFSRGLAVKERLLFSEILAEEKLGRIGRLLIQVTFFTFSVEILGAFLLYSARDGSFSQFNSGLFLNSVFHSVSAFCNAGFSLFSAGLYDSSVRDNGAYSYIIIGLITMGGLGFPVVNNLANYFRDKLNKVRSARTLLTSQTKMVLVTSALLAIVGTSIFVIMEGEASFSGLSLLEKVRHSLFLSVAARTAGYNIWPTDLLSVESIIFMMFLMWIGGSPMSTAGGIKTLTFAVAWLNFTAILRGAKRVIVFGREVADETIQKSYAIIFGSILTVVGGSLLLVMLQPDMDRVDLFFEVVSAFGTVGLSRGVTADLSTASKLLISIIMFVGRLGILVVLNSFYRRYKEPPYEYLKESISIS